MSNAVKQPSHRTMQRAIKEALNGSADRLHEILRRTDPMYGLLAGASDKLEEFFVPHAQSDPAFKIIDSAWGEIESAMGMFREAAIDAEGESNAG